MASRVQKLTAAQEAAIDDYLRGIGLTPAENADEAKGSGDRIVNGEGTEYKTISGVIDPNSDTLSAAISNRAMNARSQARHVVVDTRGQTASTEAIALRGAIRALNADNKVAPQTGEFPKLATIRVIFLDGSGNAADILVPRHE